MAKLVYFKEKQKILHESISGRQWKTIMGQFLVLEMSFTKEIQPTNNYIKNQDSL